MSRAIETRIAEFLNDSKLEWVKPAVRQHRFLPLYFGWISVLCVRPDGSFVRWDCEDDRANVKLLWDASLQRLAICQGSKKYPELRMLLPERPAAAQTCGTCGGLGQLSSVQEFICDCGGMGWIVPGEPREPTPG